MASIQENKAIYGIMATHWKMPHGIAPKLNGRAV